MLIEVSEVIGSGQENNILVIGDSTVANGIMLNKWNTLAKEAKIMINFIGTKGNDINMKELVDGQQINLRLTKKVLLYLMGLLILKNI